MQEGLFDAHTSEKHVHSRARWLGISGDQAANDWALDDLNPYVAISGDDEYGADADDEAKVLGTDDTPIIAGQQFFDLHRLLIVGVSQNTVYKLRIVYDVANMAAGIAAGRYSETMVIFDASNPQLSAGIPLDVQMPKLLIDTKVWIQCWNVTNNATIEFFVGVHGYDK